MSTQELINLAITLAQHHEELARNEAGDEARSAHLATMRALDKAAMEFTKGAIPAKAGDVYLVTSRTNGGSVYRVDPRTGTCTCEAGLANKLCWHRVAAELCEQLDEQPTPAPAPSQLFAGETVLNIPEFEIDTF